MFIQSTHTWIVDWGYFYIFHWAEKKVNKKKIAASYSFDGDTIWQNNNFASGSEGIWKILFLKSKAEHHFVCEILIIEPLQKKKKYSHHKL